MLSSARCLLDAWTRFYHGFRWPGSCVWWEMVSCHLFFRPVTYPMPYWGIFPLRIRFMDLHRSHMFDDRWFHVTCSSDLSHIWCRTEAYFHFGWDLRIFMEVTRSTIDDFMSPILLTCRTSDAILGHISISDEIYGSSRRSHVRW